MSKRITMSEQIQNLNDQLARAYDDKNTLVAEANKRINEAYQEGEKSTEDLIHSLRTQINDYMEQVNKLTKELESANSNKKYYSDRNNELVNQLSAIHDMLDLIDTCLPRHKDQDKYQEYPVITRLMSYFVQKAK